MFGSFFSSISSLFSSAGQSSLTSSLLQVGLMAGAMTLLNGSSKAPDAIQQVTDPALATQFKGTEQAEIQLGDPEQSEESKKRKKQTAKSKFKIARKGADEAVGLKPLQNRTAGVQL